VYAEYFPNSPAAKLELGQNPTLADKLAAFITDCEKAESLGNMSHATLKGYRTGVRRLTKPFGKHLLRDLKAAELRDWIKDLGLTAKTVRNILTPLRAVLADAVNDDTIPSNPLDKIDLDRLLAKHAKQSKYIVDPLTPSEVAAVLAASQGAARNYIQFAINTGLRMSESLGLRWEDVDLPNRVVHVRRALVIKKEKRPKTAAGNRVVELNAEAVAALEAQRALTLWQRDRVFSQPRTGKLLDDVQQLHKAIWKPALRKAKVRYRNPYQTRHTYASNHVSRGSNVWWLAQQMGHSNTAMIIKVYGKWMPEAGSHANRTQHTGTDGK
jgi:integrase